MNALYLLLKGKTFMNILNSGWRSITKWTLQNVANLHVPYYREVSEHCLPR